MSHFLTIPINENGIALLQAAADTDSLAPGQLYGRIQQCVPKLRMLITTSANDTALGKWYPEALGVANLTPLHLTTAAAYGAAGNWGGQHSDINRPQIYDMLARFFGQ